MSKIRILSLDGGGIRGIMPGTILTYLEDKIKQETGRDNASIGEYFDLIAGTSTGGILACVYLTPNDLGNYAWSAKQALDIYLEYGDDIFDVTFRQKLKSLGGIKDEKYDAKELENQLKKNLGNTKLSQLLKPCLITSYDIERRKTKFFTSHDATEPKFDYWVRDVARATSAAPTYFEPAMVKSLSGIKNGLIDGGMFANNPTLCAYAEARTMNFRKILNNPNKPDKPPTAKDMIIVSLGTGSQKNKYPYDDYKDAGMVKWIKPLIDIMMSGNSETVDYQLRQIFDTLEGDDKKNYYRIEPKISNGASPEMDNAEKDNLKALHKAGQQSVKENQAILDEIVKKLVANQ